MLSRNTYSLTWVSLTLDMRTFDYAKAFDCVDHNKLWKLLKETGISDHLTCFLTCVQISQEADQVVWYSHLFQNFPQFIV